MTIAEHPINSNISKNAVLLVATLSAFTVPLLVSSINIALPSIGKEFTLDAVLLSWVVTSFTLATAVFLVPFGRIADIHGRKRIFTYGICIYIASCLLSASSTSATMLISCLVLQGLGGAMIFVNGVAILTSVFPPGERGRALGINAAAVYIALSLGPFLGGILTEHFGWRSIFLANVPLGLTTLIFIVWKLRAEWAEAKGRKFDLVGSIIYGLALLAIMAGFSLLPKLLGIGMTILGILGILAFIKWETKVSSPVLNINLFRGNAVFTFANLSALINYSATFAVTFLLSLYLQHLKGLSPQSAGLVLLSMPAVQAVFSPVAGRLSDRIEPRIVASFGMALTVVGLVLLYFLEQNTSIAFILTSLIVIGFGFAFFSSPNTNSVMSSVDKRFYGVASATQGTMRLVGMMLSLGIAMLLFSIYIGRVEITPEYYPDFSRSLKTAFAIFATLCFGGVFASLAGSKVQLKRYKEG